MIDVAFLIYFLLIGLFGFFVFGLIEYYKFKKWVSGLNEAKPYQEQMHKFPKYRVEQYNKMMKEVKKELYSKKCK
jgi:hypothetical protein